MRKFNTLKLLVLSALVALQFGASAQITFKPLSASYGNDTLAAFGSNYYLNWVGIRFTVTTPSAIAGEKIITVSNDGSGSSSMWGGNCATASITNVDCIMPQAGDSLADNPITVDMTGKIALIYRGLTNFSCKSQAAQAAGAIGCIIINNIPGSSPVGMALGTCTGTTIPVMMVGYEDGNAMANQLREGIPVKVSLFNWSQGLNNDLGFIYRAAATYHDGAIPYSQIIEPGMKPYAGMDGAYVANFGTTNQTNVKLKGTTTFTPTGGSVAVIHTDSVTLASFATTDSVMAMYAPEYDLASSITGTGTVGVTYNLSATALDQYLADNTFSYTFEVTPNVFSKGRYDVANHKPITGSYVESAAQYPYMWGDMYYVARGGVTADSLQFSCNSYNSTSNTLNAVLPSSNINFYLMKWNDTMTVYPGGLLAPHSGAIQNGELTLYGAAFYSTTPTDSSYHFWTLAITDSNGVASSIVLDSGWYYLAAEMPQSSANTFGLGCDGIANGYIRAMGRDHMPMDSVTVGTNKFAYIENYAPFWPGNRTSPDTTMIGHPYDGLNPAPFGGKSTLDSVIFNSQKGLVPNIPLMVTMWPSKNTTVETAAFDLKVFPNPATSYVTAAVGFPTMMKEVKYTILDTKGNIVSTTVHNNVNSENYTYSTEKLASGMYYMVIAADGKSMFRKFTVLK
jgi:PA domain/Secretion system C-terminal sorting domain